MNARPFHHAVWLSLLLIGEGVADEPIFNSGRMPPQRTPARSVLTPRASNVPNGAANPASKGNTAIRTGPSAKVAQAPGERLDLTPLPRDPDRNNPLEYNPRSVVPFGESAKPDPEELPDPIDPNGYPGPLRPRNERTFDSPPAMRNGMLDLDAAPGAGSDEFVEDGEFYTDDYYAHDVGFGLFHGFYARAEYLLWKTSGMYVPPLVTTSSQTTRPGAGAIGDPQTTLLFGDDYINQDLRSGGRITLGTYLDSCRTLGLEGDYFALGDETTNFTQSSNGTPILTRPFFDITTGLESAELVAFPGVIAGTVSVDALTQFQGAGLRFRYAMCQGCGCDNSWCDPCCSVTTGYRMSLLAGYRYLSLRDRLTIREQLSTLNQAPQATFDITDSFHTDNQFHGGDIGAITEWRRGRWSLELLTKIALGSTHQLVNINGSTTTNDGTGAVTEPGGILAASGANMGEYSRNVFAVVPELGLTAGYQFLPHWRFLVGYSFIYWSRVARAGNQVDLDVNPDLFPPAANTNFATRPRFAFVDSDFWAQGLNIGIEGRW